MPDTTQPTPASGLTDDQCARIVRASIDRSRVLSGLHGHDGSPPDVLLTTVAEIVAQVRSDERRRCVEAIVQAAPPLNSELLYDGREDPTAAAYVEGFKDAWSAVSDLSDERVDDRERDRRVKAEVWREGFHAGRNADHNSSWWPPNPYRERAADLRGGES